MVRFLPLVVALGILAAILNWRGQIVTTIKKAQFNNSPVATELLSKQYINKILVSDGKFHGEETSAVWFNREVSAPTMELATKIMENPQQVLGESTGSKWIEVDLDKQRLYAHDGNQIVYNMAVSTGLPWFPTVTGEFRIWAKLRATRMTGGSVGNGTFYDLPNVPFVQYFYKGYGLHGTYWHSDFGKPRSHGCVNLSIPDAEKLFYWTNPQVPSDQYSLYNISPDQATRVVVHGTTPTNIY